MAHDKRLRFETAGYSVEDLLFADPGPAQCGQITDGVCFWHDARGGWVLRYSDLIALTRAAAQARGYTLELSQSADAVDPVAASSADPSTRDK